MPLSARELWAIGVSTVLFRAAVFAVVTLGFHVPFDRYVVKGDTSSYVRYARAMRGESGGMTEYDTRVFPGYPAMIALGGTIGVSMPWAALGITWLSSGVAAAVSAALFRDRCIGWAMVALYPPHYVINSALGMSEAPLLAVTLTGLLLAREKPVGSLTGGILLGFAGLVRPVACFAVAGQVLARMRSRSFGSAIAVGLTAATVVAAGVVTLHAWTGDALRAVRVNAQYPTAYDGQMFVWPFKSLIFTPIHYADVTAGRIVYIWAHVLVTIVACLILARRVLRKDSDPLDVLAFVWLIGNTLLVLCMGSYWGFHHFPRFTIPAMPALLWACRDLLPRRWYIWTALWAGLFVFAVLGVKASP